jgi:ATP-binding cassette subfamily B protein
VAHRIETIIHADQIYLMDQGRCVDRGKHNSLLKSSQLYNNVIKVLQKP